MIGTTTKTGLRRQLGLGAVAAIVMGDMLGSGIFFTPGELASVAEHPWEVYFIWGLCGLIVLCGALTLGELASLLPRAGASYHIIREGFGPFWGFAKAWVEIWVAGPGSVAGVAIVFGEFLTRFLGPRAFGTPSAWGVAAIALFVAINLMGVRWGGRTQIALTAIKILGLLSLVVGSLLLAEPAPSLAGSARLVGSGGPLALLRVVGLGVAAVLFTYDGWSDVSHVAGEVDRPERNLPLGLPLGVAAITGLYLVVNYAYLRVVPLAAMGGETTTVAATVALRSFGSIGGRVVNGLIMISIFGALGGLVMTLPRFFFAAASDYEPQTRGSRAHGFFQVLSVVSPRTAVPTGAIWFCAALSCAALWFFGTFGRLVSYIVVPLQFANILMVAAVFRLRRRVEIRKEPYRTPGYPVVPSVFILVMSLFLVSAILYHPVDTLVGVAMAALSIPAYFWITKREAI